MSITIRKTSGPIELDVHRQLLASLMLLVGFSTFDDPGIVDGTTDGKLQTGASVDYRIAGVTHTKAATDDLWDLSGQTDTIAGQYRAYWLYLDASGTASVGAGSNATSAAAALAALPTPPESKAIIGVYVAGPSTDFNGAAGLEAQGTVHDGLPEGVPIGVPSKTYVAPQGLSFVSA